MDQSALFQNDFFWTAPAPALWLLDQDHLTPGPGPACLPGQPAGLQYLVKDVGWAVTTSWAVTQVFVRDCSRQALSCPATKPSLQDALLRGGRGEGGREGEGRHCSYWAASISGLMVMLEPTLKNVGFYHQCRAGRLAAPESSLLQPGQGEEEPLLSSPELNN